MKQSKIKPMYRSISGLLSSQKGVGLLEVVGGVAVMAVVMYFLTSGFQDMNIRSQNLSMTSLCSQTKTAVLDRIASFGTADRVMGAFVPTTANTDRYGVSIASNADYLAVPASDRNFVPAWFNPAWGLPIISSTSTPVINNAQLMMQSVVLLQDLLNSDTNYCLTGKSILNLIYPNVSTRPARVSDITLRIQPFDLTTGTVKDCTSGGTNGCGGGVANTIFSSAPRRGTPKPTAGFSNISNSPGTDGFCMQGNSDLGFIATVTVSVAMPTPTGGVTVTPSSTITPAGPMAATCTDSRKFQHALDRINLTTISLVGGAPTYSGTPLMQCGVAGVCPAVNPPIALNPRFVSLSSQNPVRVSLQFANLEPGSVILCRDKATGTVYPCDQVRLLGHKGTLAAIPTLTTWTPATSILAMDFNVPIQEILQLEVFAVDTAGNPSASSGNIRFQVITAASSP